MKRVVLAMLAACAPLPPRNPLATWVPSPNREPRRPILIVLHATEQDSVRESLDTLRSRNGGGPVSAHYLIGRDGRRFQLVADQERAWHAGAGRWGTITDVNNASIGIELDNDGKEPFSDAQIARLIELLDDLTLRYDIPRHLVVGHGDIAPTRKNDPSVLFPWRRLAQAGFGLWPDGRSGPAPAGFDPWVALRLIGYDLSSPDDAVRAFHRHYRGNEDAQWQPGDFDLLYDLQRQLAPPPSPVSPMQRD